MSFIGLARRSIRDLSPYKPGKPISELKREYGIENVIKLASNENPLGPSPLAITELRKGIASLNFYPDGNGFELKEKLSNIKRVKLGQITLGNGSDDIFNFVIRAFATDQDEVMVSEYAFAAYAIAAKVVGANVNVVPSNNWGHDLNAMLEAINEKTKVIFIANPNNPTGTWNTEHEIHSFLKLVPKNIIIVIDQAYHEYILDAEGYYRDAADFLKEFPNLIVTYTFSKAYGLAGLRVGYSLSSVEIADILNRTRLPFNVNSLGLLAAKAALDDKEHLHNTLEITKRGLAFFSREFAKLGLEYISLTGNFVTVDVGTNADNIYNALLKRGIIVRPLGAYKMTNFLRVSVGKHEHNEKFIEVFTDLYHSGIF